MPTVYAARGRPAGRGRPRGPLLHAVPGSDRTRSAVCGERVGGARRPWQQRAAGAAGPPIAICTECAALVEQHAMQQHAMERDAVA